VLRVKDHQNLVRDPVSKAIINIDTAGLEAYNKKKEELRRRNSQLDQNTQAISELKNDMEQIKNMLILLLNK
jgi:uncharacterized protein involved in exopolysaccharide biosynthesis